MESLYRTYRPQTFADVVGQTHVVRTLETAILEGRISHAYLFCGPRGTGKTTVARLLAKALLCKAGAGHLPDGTCEECRLIATGEHPDVHELDAASNRGIDAVRDQIISSLEFASVRGSYKVYIVDEVHMFTKEASNALLKTLEEPPDHVVFILCTTDPEAILKTILSRVQRFDFRSITASDIKNRLEYVCKQEGFTYDPAALELIAQHAQGGLRDALTALEQISVFAESAITVEATQGFLGEASSVTMRTVSEALALRDTATLFREVAKLVSAGSDLAQFVRGLSTRVRDLYVLSVVGKGEGVVEAHGQTLDALMQEAQAFGSSDRLARALSILGDVDIQMRKAHNQRLVLEIALTRIARPQTDLTIESLAERVEDLEKQIKQLGVVGEPTPAVAQQRVVAQVAPAPATPTAPAPAAPTAPAPAAKPVVPLTSSSQPTTPMSAAPVASHATAVSVTVPTVPAPKTPAPPAQSTSAASTNQPADETPSPLQHMWQDVVDEMLATYPPYGSLLVNAMATEDDGATLTVTLPERSNFALRMLGREDVKTAMTPVIEKFFGTRRVVYCIGSPASRVQPAQATQPAQAARSASAEHTQATRSAPVEPASVQPAQRAASAQKLAHAQPASVQPAQRAASTQKPAPVEPASVQPAQRAASVQKHVEPAKSTEVPTKSTQTSIKRTAKAAPKNTEAREKNASKASESLLPESLAAMLEDVFGPGVTVSTIREDDMIREHDNE